MALPNLADKINAVEDKIEKENIISEIAKAVFKSAKITTEAAAKFAVAPSVPQMVDDVLDDLKSGSIDKFNKAMDKLDKLVRVLGIDLKKYNKELANFAEKREEKIIKSEEKIQTLRENNIVADITPAGDVNVLSQKEIESKQKDLRDTEKRINDLEKKIAKDTKQVQDPGLFQKELKTTAQFNKKEEIKRDTEELEQKKKERDESKQVLGSRGDEQPGVFQRASEGAGNFVDEYIPDQIRDVAGAFTEGLTAPFSAIKELGMGFAQMLKPLKILKPLFTGLVGSLKKFALGLKASVVAFLPYLAITGIIVLGLAALFYILKKFKDRFGSKKDNEFDMGPQETDVTDADLGIEPAVAAENNFGSRMQRKGFFTKEGDGKNKFIEPDDPNYDRLYESKHNRPAPKKGQVYMGDGKVSILPIDKEGNMNPMELRKMEAEGFKLKPNPLLTPLDPAKEKGSTNVSQVVDNSSKVRSDTIVAGGLDGSNNNDWRSSVLLNY